MDVFDQASALEERDREAALQTRKPQGPQARGVCLWCDEAVEDGRRWCGVECRDNWERRVSSR